LAYGAVRGGVQQLYVRALDNIETKTLAGTEGATYPFFSPDSQWLGFIANGKLKKVSVSGGLPVTLFDAAPQGGTWTLDDRIVFRGIGDAGLLAISPSGGAAHPVAPAKTNEDTGSVGSYPEFLPGGEAMLVTSTTAETVTADEKLVE